MCPQKRGKFTDAYHLERQDLVILAVTSQSRDVARIGEALITKQREAGLLRPSVLKPVLATIERSLVLRTLGRLADEDLATLRRVLAEILGAQGPRLFLQPRRPRRVDTDRCRPHVARRW